MFGSSISLEFEEKETNSVPGKSCILQNNEPENRKTDVSTVCMSLNTAKAMKNSTFKI